MPQHLYTARFVGRTRGAIGIVYPIAVEVAADSPEQARVRLYDTHEHIAGLTLARKASACPNCGQWQYAGADCLNECKRRGFAVEVSDAAL